MFPRPDISSVSSLESSFAPLSKISWILSYLSIARTRKTYKLWGYYIEMFKTHAKNYYIDKVYRTHERNLNEFSFGLEAISYIYN